MPFDHDNEVSLSLNSLENLQPYCADHEQRAERLLYDGLATRMGDAFSRAVFWAETVCNRPTQHIVDDDLMPWAKNKFFPDSVFADSRYPEPCEHLDGHTAAMERMLGGLRKLGMFSLARNVFAERHKLRFYWLYDSVFLLVPQGVSLPLKLAFQYHAYHLEWGFSGIRPPCMPSVADARALVRDRLLLKYRHGLRFVHGLTLQFRNEPDALFPLPYDHPLFEATVAFLGSVTGREVLREQLGLVPAFYDGCMLAAPETCLSSVSQLHMLAGEPAAISPIVQVG